MKIHSSETYIDFIFKIQRFFEAKCEAKNFQNIDMSYSHVGSYIILQMLILYTPIKKALREYYHLSLSCVQLFVFP